MECPVYPARISFSGFAPGRIFPCWITKLYREITSMEADRNKRPPIELDNPAKQRYSSGKINTRGRVR